MLTAEQIRAARGLLRWSANELGQRAGVHISTVQRLERRDGPVHGTVVTLRKIQGAFEESGVIFVDDEARLGVCLSRGMRRAS